MSGLSIGKAPSNAVVLPFYGTGAIAFLALTILMFLSSFPLLGGYFHPHILAFVHTAALGWGTMVIFGASYQLLPVISERDLYSERIGEVSYYFLASGALALIITFWIFEIGWWMVIGGCLILIGAILYLINTIKTIGNKFWEHPQKLFIFSSALWLIITVIIGIILALNLKYQFIISRSHFDFLKIHAHIGLAGWFLQLVVGISAKLVPMFLLSHIKKDPLLIISFILQNIALVLFVVDGYFYGPNVRFLVYGALVLAGIFFWLLYLRFAYLKKIKKPDLSLKHTFLAFLSLLIAVGLLPIVYYADDGRWVILYGFFLFVGWISSIILGMTFKTLPFIVWNNKYKMLNGKVKIPLPKDLFWQKVFDWQFWLFVAALYIIALSLIFANHLFLQIGLGIMVITAILYLINTFKVITHKVSKELQAYGN